MKYCYFIYLFFFFGFVKAFSQSSIPLHISIASDGNSLSVAENSVDGIEKLSDAIANFLDLDDQHKFFINMDDSDANHKDKLFTFAEKSDSSNVLLMSVAGAWANTSGVISEINLDADNEQVLFAGYLTRFFSFFPVGCGFLISIAPESYQLPEHLFSSIEDDGKGGKYVIFIESNTAGYQSVLNRVTSIFENSTLPDISVDEEGTVQFSDLIAFLKSSLRVENISYTCIKIKDSYDQTIYRK